MENAQLKAILILVLVAVGGGFLTFGLDVLIGYEYTQRTFIQGVHDLIQKLQGGVLLLAWFGLSKTFAKNHERKSG
jgi:hypothetical protein